MPWGYLLSLDCAGCEPSSIKNSTIIENLVKHN